MKRVDKNLLKSVITQNEYQNRLKEEEEMWSRYQGDSSSRKKYRKRSRSKSDDISPKKKSNKNSEKDPKRTAKQIDNDDITTDKWNNDKFMELYPEDLKSKKMVNHTDKNTPLNYDLNYMSISHVLGDGRTHQLVKYLKSKGHKKV